MAGITGSLVMMNKAITVGASGSASDAGGDAGGGGGGTGGGGAGDPNGPNGPGGGGGDGGGSHQGASPPSPGAPTGHEGQAHTGHPVDVLTGTMFTPPVVDFVLHGLLEVYLQRGYRTSAVQKSVGIGYGWSHSIAWRAHRKGGVLTLVDDEHRETTLHVPDAGQRVLLPYGRSIQRGERDDSLIVDVGDGFVRVLRPLDERTRSDASSATTAYVLSELRDGHGHLAEVEWTRGEVSKIVDSVGRVASLRIAGLTKTWSMTVRDETGVEHTRYLVSYELDARGDLVRVVDAGGATTEYAYDDEHYLVSETQPDGIVYTFRYESHAGEKRCVETLGQLRDGDVLAELGAPDRGQAPPHGLFHARLSYGPAPRSTTVIDALGQTHRYEGNTLGLVTAYVDPRGQRRELAYDARGQVIQVVTADGAVETRIHDQNGLLAGFRDGAGRGIVLSRRPDGALSAVIDPAGGRWRFEHDASGRLVSRTDPCGGVTRFAYDTHGQTSAITRPDGASETRAYDAHGNLRSLTNAAGATWKYIYDLFGMPARIETPAGAVYHLEFDSRGSLLSCRGPAGLVVEHQYDAKGHLVATRHPGGAISRWRFVADALVESRFADGRHYRYGYDAMKQPVWIQNAAGERMSMERDAAGNIVREVSFAGLWRTFEYDVCNRVIRASSGSRQQSYEYDRSSNLVRQEAEGTELTYEYDGLGMLIRAVGGATEVCFERDALGRVTRETQRVGGWTFSVEREFDAGGWTTFRRYSSGWAVHTVRNGAGHVRELTTTGSSGETETTTFEYDANWRERWRRCTNGYTIETRRDEESRPVHVEVRDPQDRSIRTRTYEWAASGPLAAVADSERGRRTYELDPVGRPLAVSGLGTNESICYSTHGVPACDGTSVRTGGRVVETRDAGFRWDHRGRLAERVSRDPLTSWSLDYDGYDRLVAVTRGDGKKTQYVYDAFGRRIAELCDDGRSTWFGWDGDATVEERTTNSPPVRRVFHDDGYTPLLESIGDASEWRAVVCDAAGTPWLYVGADGVRGEIDLTAWGNVARAVGQTGGIRFAGQRADDTPFVYNRSRYYSPEIGTFLSPDPLGIEKSLVDVGFVPNATLYVDPLGLAVVQMSDDPPCPEYARARAAATGQRLVHYSQLGPGALAGEGNVDLVTHGVPGYAQYGNSFVSGPQMGATFRAAGFTGSNVHMTCCNGGTDYPGYPGTSVAQGIANQTGATTVGCVGDLMYVDRHNPAVSVAGPNGVMLPFTPNAPPRTGTPTIPMRTPTLY